ncbi:MAG: TetR/AcrR family transcriptional regulator, partial [Moraxellaceae bacterium]
MNEYRNRLINGLAHVLEHEHKTLASITIADIVAASKVSKRTFYENFNSKEQCFLALYEQNSYRILNKVITLAQQHATHSEATLESLVHQV